MNKKSDLRALNILLVGGRPASVQVLRTAFGLLGICRIVAVAESERAIEALRLQSFDAVFCDCAADAVNNLSFPVAARRSDGILNPMLPIFVIYPSARQRQVEQARDGGVTDVLTHPVSAATIARKLIAALNTPRPFIVASGFCGPDRRVRRPVVWSGDERRRRLAKKARLPVPETPTDDLIPV